MFFMPKGSFVGPHTPCLLSDRLVYCQVETVTTTIPPNERATKIDVMPPTKADKHKLLLPRSCLFSQGVIEETIVGLMQ